MRNPSYSHRQSVQASEWLACHPSCHTGRGPYELVDVDEDAGFGVLRGHDVPVDGNSPSLVTAELYIAIQSVYEGRKIRTEEEDIDATER